MQWYTDRINQPSGTPRAFPQVKKTFTWGKARGVPDDKPTITLLLFFIFYQIVLITILYTYFAMKPFNHSDFRTAFPFTILAEYICLTASHSINY